ncbi:LysM peptidoglycan-binding and 3D domain-containing protein [Peribacillus asahii]|uniref:LysM peptidoglycan-binding and 3D domain-containing protein n=1 Tax=Peribacillus asahii TaxID=228899 RepID=UPI002079239B|nr:LysM peptidoglycan-binding and 3D domain-containing protein [Peribacillus asahii]USK68618.1 LysM peptidoglycan-binding domain-containing protein [Peribacillus asahii]
MKKSILSLVAAAAISSAFTSPVQAEDVELKDGDTLWGLSQTYKASIEEIKSWNQLSSDTIYAGETLQIFQEVDYTVESGDTLSEIAHENDVSVNDLKSWNGLNSDTIYPEQNLVMKPGVNKVEIANVESETKSEQAVPANIEEQEKTVSKSETTNQSDIEKEITVRATAYTADCQGCIGTTATGVDLKSNPDAKVVAVDPSVIPLGSKVYVEGYGYATAEDTGSAIKGNRVDVFIPNEQDALNWGVKTVKVQVLD